MYVLGKKPKLNFLGKYAELCSKKALFVLENVALHDRYIGF